MSKQLSGICPYCKGLCSEEYHEICHLRSEVTRLKWEVTGHKVKYFVIGVTVMGVISILLHWLDKYR